MDCVRDSTNVICVHRYDKVHREFPPTLFQTFPSLFDTIEMSTDYCVEGGEKYYMDIWHFNIDAVFFSFYKIS